MEQQQPSQETITEAVNNLRDEVKNFVEKNSTLLLKETTTPKLFHAGESDHKLPLAEAPKKTPTLEEISAIMKAKEGKS